MPQTPAVVLGRRSEALAWNALGHRLVAGHLAIDAPGRPAERPDLARLVGELTVQSAEFARLWARHPVAVCVSGTKLLRHPEVGELELYFEVLAPPDDSGQRVLLYTAEPGSPSASALDLLSRSDSPADRQAARLPFRA